MPALACQGSSYCLLCGKNQILVYAFVLLPFGLHHRPWSVVSWSGGPFRASDHPNFSQKALVIRLGDAFRELWPGEAFCEGLGSKRAFCEALGLCFMVFHGPGVHSARAR